VTALDRFVLERVATARRYIQSVMTKHLLLHAGAARGKENGEQQIHAVQTCFKSTAPSGPYRRLAAGDTVSNAEAGHARLNARLLGQSCGPGLGNVPAALLLWALSAAVAGLLTFGCGTPHAILDISVPPSAIAASPFTITVTAMVGGSRDTVINTGIHFTSSDRSAVLPADYYFTAADAGSHSFTNGVTLMTAGSQRITATGIGVPGLNGTANVTVSLTTAADQMVLR